MEFLSRGWSSSWIKFWWWIYLF